jgi:S1-C subfamily serine protease
MTEESRGPHETPSPEEGEPAFDEQAAQPSPSGNGDPLPADADPVGGAASASSAAGAGAGDVGFAPPDRPGYVPPIPPGSMPNQPAPPRPAFTPPNPTRPPLGAVQGAYAWPPGQAGQAGQAPYSAHEAHQGGPAGQPPQGGPSYGGSLYSSTPGGAGSGGFGGPPNLGGPAGPAGPGGPGDGGTAGFGGQPSWVSTPPLPAAGTGERRGISTGMFMVLALVIALVAGGVGAGVGGMFTGGEGDPATVSGVSIGSQPSGSASRRPGSIPDVASKVKLGVVMIKVADGAGSGFIVENGHIITNNHVVEQADSGPMQVVFHDGKTASAQVVGRDPNTDVAVIKPEGVSKLTSLALGNSDAIQVGDSVIAVGSPFGLSGTVTSGIVSATNRPLQAGGEDGGDAAVFNAIQTDAAINPGNSGGPLVDEKGRVVGINSVIKTAGGDRFGEQQGGNIGLGFAIPINQAKRVAEQLIKTGKAEKAIIGATMNMQFQGRGAQIAPSTENGQPPILQDGPAEKAGLRPGDVIVKFNNKPINAPDELIAEIRSRTPGDKVKLTYTRGSKQQTADLTLAAG